MADEDEKKEEGKEDGEKPGFKEKLPKILKGLALLANFGVMLGGLYVVYYVKIGYQRPVMNEETETAAHQEKQGLLAEQPVLYSFEPFTVNLRGRPRKIVQASIQLEMLNEQGYEEAVNVNPVARDKIVRIFNAKSFEDIESIQGKLFLKDQILTTMNQILKTGSVKEVYFSEFIVQ